MSAPRGKIQLLSNQSGGTRRVFISYAHADGPKADDGDLPRAVYEAVCMLADNRPELGLARERIFFDRTGLLAGDAWEDKIRSEIQHADVFLLLMSIRTMNSSFCMDKELQWAAASGAAIVPVLMSQCLWDNRPVNLPAGTRTLGSFNAIPKDANNDLVPIKDRRWDDRDAALTRLAQQLAAAMAHEAHPPAEQDRAAVQAGPRTSPSAPHGPRLPLNLPLLCNQFDAESDFRHFVLNDWEPGKLLLVFVRGGYEDHPEGFWERLCERELAHSCETQGLTVRPPKRLRLPNAMNGNKLRASLADDVRAALSEALTGNMFRLKTPAEIVDALPAQAVQPLLATLPSQPDAGNAALLRELLAWFDAAPRRAPLDRLVLAVLVSDPQLCADPGLVPRFGLEGAQRVQALCLHELEALSAADVRDWHANYELESLAELPRLTQALFGERAELRMRPFDRAARQLLGL
ncbi:MAG: toll/interleukin-1 receptor domain-containing protein [Rubrivivax sp.]|nr:toll/interleukin-1 receptor domain-containing protein [Rubrivivax sp.]